MKNQKGITIIALVITIVILLILTGVVTYSGMESVNTAKKTTFISELEMIQAKVNVIYEERKTSSEKVDYYNSIGQDISNVNLSRLTETLGETSKNGFRYFTSIDLKKIDLDNINQDVIINFDTRDVRSLTGIQINGVRYYRLIDIPNYVGYNVDYTNKNTQAPTFNVSQTKLSDNEYRFTIKDIVYNSNVNGGTVSYKLNTDTNWILNGESTSFIVKQPGLYDIKFTDNAGNSSTVQKWIYVENGLLAYFDGENNTGNGHNSSVTTWKDLSENGNDATIEGINYTDASGWKEKAIQLDGVDDVVTLPVPIPVAGTFSVEIIFTEQDYEKINILNADKEWKSFCAHTWVNGSIYIGGNYTSANTDRLTPIEIDFRTIMEKTDSMVYTYNGITKQATFYVNGKKLAQKTYTADPEEIEYFEIANSQKMYSKISFYDRVLEDNEVKTNYSIDQYRFGITE